MEAVFTAEKRVTFVEKTLSEVGAGTAYPAAATLDQIAEIYYRVKDIQFSGGMSWDYDNGIDPPIAMTFSAPSSMPANRTVEDPLGSGLQTRGYSILGAYPYNGDTYDAGYGGYYSDIADREVGMWKNRWNEDLTSEGMYYYITHTCVTAFTYVGESTLPPDSTWWGYAETGGNIMCRMGRTVAVVKTNPANGLFDPTNIFYIEFEFSWFDFEFPVNFGGLTNIYDGVDGDVSSFVSSAGNYTLRLQTGDILIPIYQYALEDSTGHGCSVIHEATEWWPYAKNSPAVPVWNSATGAKL